MGIRQNHQLVVWITLFVGSVCGLSSSAVAQTCLSENFDALTAGVLNGQSGWGGSAIAGEIDVIADGGGQAVQITGGAAAVDAARTGLICAVCPDGSFTATIRVKAGSSAAENLLWNVNFNNPGGANLARWQGTGLTAQGRIGGTAYLTSSVTLTGPATYDELKVFVDVTANTTTFFFNGTNLGTLQHDVGPGQGAVGDNLGTVNFVRVAGSPGTDTVLLDDLTIEGCPGTCYASVTPKLPKNVSSPLGGPASPSSIDYVVKNVNTDSLTVSITEVDAAGASFDHSWLSLSTGSTGVLASSASATVTASFNSAALSAGLYEGFIKFTDDCSPTHSWTRLIRLFVGTPVQCFTETFPYADGPLSHAGGGWLGSITGGTPANTEGAIEVDGNYLRLTFAPLGNPGDGTTSYFVTRTLPAPVGPDANGKITCIIRMERGTTTVGFSWKTHFNSATTAIAQWDGQGTNCRARNESASGGQFGTIGNVLQNLTGAGTFDELKVVSDFNTGVAEYYFKGVLLGTITHMGAIGQKVQSISIQRQARGEVDAQLDMRWDDISVTGDCDTTCSFTVSPATGVVSTALAGNPAVPAAHDYSLTNVNSTVLSYTAQEVDSSGAPVNHDWLSLNSAAGSLTPEEIDSVVATVDSTGKAPGEYIGFLKFENNCASPASVMRGVKMFLLGEDLCLSDSFSYPNAALNGQPGWSGTSASEIQVLNGEIRINGGSGSTTVSESISSECPSCSPEGGLIFVKIMAKGGLGTSNIWRMIVRDPAGIEFGGWQGTGTTVRGRTDLPGGVVVTDTITLSTSSYSELEMRINPDDTRTIRGVPPNATQFLINGVAVTTVGNEDPAPHFNPIPYGTLSTGDSLGTVDLQRVTNPGTESDFILLDDLSATRCIEQCNDPVFDVRDTSNAVAQDNLVTVHDFNILQNECATGPTPGAAIFDALSFECRCMDVDGNQAVDMNDFGRFQRCYTGPSGTVDVSCDDD